jgi:nitrogen regulatory protein P-II 1
VKNQESAQQHPESIIIEERSGEERSNSPHITLTTSTMKKIEAIIRRSKFEEVKAALHAIDIDFFSYTESYGVGNEKKKKDVFRGSSDTDFISRLSLSIVVRDINLRKTVDCLLKSAYTGEIGDGKIFVWTIEESYRIRTGESGDDSMYNKD